MSQPPLKFAPRAEKVGGRTVLGLVVDCIDDSYQNELFVAMAEAAKLRNVNLLCFAGGSLGHLPKQRRAYELANAKNVDALIFSVGTLETGVGAAGVLGFLAEFADMPRVCIGLPVPGVPSVLVDNVDGTRRIVTHLIESHRRRRIAFIGGPESNDEARARLSGYRQALAAAAIDWDPKLYVGGDFLFDSGVEAVQTLLQRPGAPFDAVVAANDDMALGAMEELKRRGLAVPDHLAVVGFDDGVRAEYSYPTLTTMRQPIAAQARAAVDLALSLCAGEAATGRVYLDAELVCRRSCGCPLEQKDFAVDPPHAPRRGSEKSPLFQRRGELIGELQQVGAELLSPSHAERLVDAFVAGLLEKPHVSFAAEWDAALSAASAKGEDLRRFHALTNAIRRSVVPSIIDLHGMLVRGETMLHESRVLLATQIQRQEGQRRLTERRAFQIMGELGRSVTTCTERQELLESLRRATKALAIPSCIVALRVAAAGDTTPQVELVLTLPETRVFDPVLPSPTHLPLALLFPGGGPKAYVTQPLFFGTTRLGFVVFELGPTDGSLYEELRAQLSAGLVSVALATEHSRNAQLHQRLLHEAARHAAALEDLFQRFSTAARSATSDADDAQAPLKTAIEALSSLAIEWAALIEREQETLRPTEP